MTGTDEHGLKVQQAAQKAQRTYQEFCNDNSRKFQDLVDILGVDYACFLRTTSTKHIEAAQEFWRVLVKNGYIYKGWHEGWYSVADETFYTDAQVEPSKDPATGNLIMVSMETGRAVEWSREENYKFKLSEFREKLLSWLEDTRGEKAVILPSSRHNEVRMYLQQSALPDLSVSRPTSRLEWGIPVPDDAGHTIYVWLDALTCYLSAIGYPHQGQVIWPADLHVIGKDILKFHAVYWPAFLMAAGLELPRQILAHAHWTIEHQKMSKSLGNVYDPGQLMLLLGHVDHVRYVLCKEGGISNDHDFSATKMLLSYNKNLKGQLGNLVSRITSQKLWPTLHPSMVKVKMDVLEEDSLKTAGNSSSSKKKRINAEKDQTLSWMKKGEVGLSLNEISNLVTRINAYLSEKEPWKITNEQEKTQVIYQAINALRIAGILLQPVMPEKSALLLDRIGIERTHRSFQHAQKPLVMEDWRLLVNRVGEKPLFPDLQ